MTSNSWSGYYYIKLTSDGGLDVGHRPQDRMSQDEPEYFSFTSDELAGISRRDFARRFADWSPTPEQVAKLDAWLAQTGVTFSGRGTYGLGDRKLRLRGAEAAQAAGELAEERTAAERAKLPMVRVLHVGEREMDTVKVIRQFGDMSLGEANELMKHQSFVVHVHDVERFVRTMEALGNTVRIEDGRTSAASSASVSAGKAKATRRNQKIDRKTLDPSTVQLPWQNDAGAIFGAVRVDGTLRDDFYEVWCDARGRDNSYVLDCMASWRGKAGRYGTKWFVILDALDTKHVPAVITSARAAHSSWQISWVLAGEPVRRDQRVLSDGAVLAEWYAPLEKRRYRTRVVRCGYSADGSEDYYRQETVPFDEQKSRGRKRRS